MERMWRKVNQGLTGRSSTKSTIQSDTASSAGFGGEHQVQVVAVSGNNNPSICGVGSGGTLCSNSIVVGTSSHLAVTGRRLASSGEIPAGGCVSGGGGGISSSFSQHVLHQSTASSERRRRRRRKSRPRTTNKNGERTLSSFRNNDSSQPTIRQSSNDGHPDISLRQRAVAKLRMFNFHLNWDLHMNQCKPCGPRSSGNIITRRLCRNRRREDNELYRSNSFKFERFERKEVNEIGSQTLNRKISVCDDYSLPIDFVKKRPSSFDPCLAETLPDNWAIVVAPSPLSEHVSFLDPPTLLKPNYPQPPPLPTQSHHHFHHNFIQQQYLQQQHNRVKLVEGYSDPKDSKKHTRIHYRKTRKDKRSSNYSSDSSAPKSSADEYENHPPNKVPDLNSPDSISEDLVRPLHPNKSPKKLTGPPEINKRNPSPYYYSDLLKSKAAASNKDAKNKFRQSTASEPPQFPSTITGTEQLTSAPYRKSTSLDVPEIDREDSAESVIDAAKNQKRYSITEEGVRIIRCQSPSTTTSDDSDCSECQQRREWHAKALALVRKTCNITALQPLHLDITGGCGEPPLPEFNINTSMPPHRLLGPAVCACAGAPPTLGDDIDEYFRPRSIFYVHPQGVHECADCISTETKTTTTVATTNQTTSNNLGKTTIVVATTKTATTSSDKSNNSSGGGKQKKQQDDDMSSGGGGGGIRTRQIYETAFDCKIARSDDDLDEVDRLTNHSILLELENGNNIKSKPPIERNKSGKTNKSSRLEGKRLKNSKNQAIQQDNNGSVSTLSNDLENIHIDNHVDQLNNANTTSTSQLPIRGYTPSPPSTAPLPVKFPGKHDHHRFYMNSIKSAPNLPSSNPAHPRLKDLRVPIQSLRHQLHSTDLPTGSNTSSILLDSGTAQPTTTESLASSSRARDRPRSVVLESGRVLELRKSSNHHNHHHHHHHHNHNHHHGAGNHTQNNRNSGHNNYSSTESMATSSSGGSMESIRSSTSEGNRSTTSSESRHSTSLSSHSSESGSSVAFPLRAPQLLLHSKLHILSPISDKSSLEPSASDASEINKKLSPAGTGVTVISSNIGIVNPITTATTTEDATLKNLSDGNNCAFITKATIEGGQQPIQQTQQNDTGSVPKQLKKRIPPNKTLLMLTDEILGSDSGISLHSREDGKIHQSAFHRFGLTKLSFPNDKPSSTDLLNSGSLCLPQDLRDLPFDMPKLRRRKIILQQDGCTSGSATSVDLGDLPFDMPKLRRRLRLNQPQTNNNNLMIHSTESSGISQASSSHSVRDDQKNIGLETGLFRQNLTLNLNESKPHQQITNNKFGSLDLRFGATTSTAIVKGLNLNLSSTGIGFASAVDLIDVTVPLERQGWYHGAITRIEAETTLRPLSEGSFLVRNCESTKQDYSLSLKGAKGFMHMRIQRNDTNQYILGQFSRPFDSIPEMIRHFCINRLPVRGAEHMCLLDPVIVQLL